HRGAGGEAAALAGARLPLRLERGGGSQCLGRRALPLRRRPAHSAARRRRRGIGRHLRRREPAEANLVFPMKLALITGSLVHGGAERQSITLANRLAERGHECHAIYLKNDPSQLSRLHLASPSSVRCLHAARYFDVRALSHLNAQLGRLASRAILATNPYALM